MFESAWDRTHTRYGFYESVAVRRMHGRHEGEAVAVTT